MTQLRVIVLVLAFLFLLTRAAVSEPTKKVIEFGWDEPNCAYLKDNITRMERAPFDGVVFGASVRRGGKLQPAANLAFGTTPLLWDELNESLAALQATPFKRFTDNFVRLNVVPGDLDWFDDFAVPVGNIKLISRFAHEGHVRGVFFDLEPYNNRGLFDYRKQAGKGTASFAEYAAQVRRRGAEVMRALQEGYPDLTLFLSFGYNVAEVESKSELPAVKYGLLPAFLDGLVEAAQGRTVLIDGYEYSYGYRTAERFAHAYQEVKTLNAKLAAQPEKYAQRIEVAFGIWVDYDSEKTGWHTDLGSFDKNGWTPAAFGTALAAALKQSDRYVWIYSQEPNWWTGEKLPAEYRQAVIDTRRELRLP